MKYKFAVLFCKNMYFLIKCKNKSRDRCLWKLHYIVFWIVINKHNFQWEFTSVLISTSMKWRMDCTAHIISHVWSVLTCKEGPAALTSSHSHVIYSPISHLCAMWNRLQQQCSWKEAANWSNLVWLCSLCQFFLCKTMEKRVMSVRQMRGCVLGVFACLSSLYHIIVQDFMTKAQACHEEIWKFVWVTDLAACCKWCTK